MLRRFSPSNVWPSAVWEDLPPCAWVTLAESPCPWVRIREKGDDAEAYAWLGRPLPLDPRRSYQVRAISSDLDRITTPAPTDAALTWVRRAVVLLCSDAPVAGGVLRQTYKVTNANALGVALYLVRTTTLGLGVVTVDFYSSGIITSVRSFGVDEDGAKPQGVVELVDSLAAGAHAPQTWQQGGYPYDVVGGAGRSFVPPALETWINFAVTTTPTVWVTLTGLLGCS